MDLVNAEHTATVTTQTGTAKRLSYKCMYAVTNMPTQIKPRGLLDPKTLKTDRHPDDPDIIWAMPNHSKNIRRLQNKK